MLKSETVARIPLFQGLPQEDLEKIRTAFTAVPLAKGATVFRAGEMADALYYVFSGRLGVFLTVEGKEQQVGQKNPGDFFGLKSILVTKLRTATIRALEDCQLFKIQRHDFTPFLANDVIFGRMIKYLSEHNYFADRGAPGRSPMFAFCSAKGGVGKTTLAANLAYAIANKGHQPVLFLDFCLEFGEARALFGKRSPQQTDLPIQLPLKVDDRFEAWLYQSDRHPNLYFLDFPPGLDAALTLRQGLDSSILEGWFQRFRERFAYVIVDLPATFDKVTLCTLKQATRILLVSDMDYFGMRSSRAFLREIREYDRDLFDRISIVLNKARALPGQAAETFEAVFEKPVPFVFPPFSPLGLRNDKEPFFIDTHPGNEITCLFYRFLNNLTGLSVPVKLTQRLWGQVSDTARIVIDGE